MARPLIITLLFLTGATAWCFMIHKASQGFNYTPDAADYLVIARQQAEGRGWTLPCKWHWYDEAPAVHSALGERPIGWPFVARFAAEVNEMRPAVTAQVLNVFIVGIAAIVWGIVAGQVAQSPLARWLMIALMLTCASLMQVAIAALTEPLYLLELGLLVLALGPIPREKVSPTLLAVVAGLMTAALCLTRPSGTIVVLAVALHLLWHRDWLKLGVWFVVTAPLLALYHWAVFRAWGDPFHSIQSAHFFTMSFTEGMFGGWDTTWPTPGAFIASHVPEITRAIGFHLLVYTEALVSPAGLSLLTPLAVIAAVEALGRWRDWTLLWLLAAGHFAGAVLTWATTEPYRLGIPVVICLLPLALGAGARLISTAGVHRRVLIATAVALCGGTLAMGLVDGWRRVNSINTFQMGQPAGSGPIEFAEDQVVCTDFPFHLMYRDDLAVVVFPFDLPERAGPAFPSELRRFVDEYDVVAFAFQNESLMNVVMAAGGGEWIVPLGIQDGFYGWFGVIR